MFLIQLIRSLFTFTLLRLSLTTSSVKENGLERFSSFSLENTSEDDKVLTNSNLLSKYTMQPLKTGTTIVGLCCKDGIILGADTRSTGGPLVMDKNKLKIHKISSLIYCCAAGTSADCDQITREASHVLSLLRLDNEFARVTSGSGYDTSKAGDQEDILYDPIPIALHSIFQSLQTPRVKNTNQMKSSVMIVGGIDETGPSLHMIDSNGVPTAVSFAALGSGSTDAIAVLENFLYKFHNVQKQKQEGLLITEGIEMVRQAVSAGILNDLGSGSHIDFCVIEKYGANLWREMSADSIVHYKGSQLHMLTSESTSDVGNASERRKIFNQNFKSTKIFKNNEETWNKMTYCDVDFI